MDANVDGTIRGWVGEPNVFGVRVGGRWVAWAIGAAPRPWEGEYAEVRVDDEGYAKDCSILAWRPVAPNPN